MKQTYGPIQCFRSEQEEGEGVAKKRRKPNGEGGNAHRNIRSKKSINKSFHPS